MSTNVSFNLDYRLKYPAALYYLINKDTDEALRPISVNTIKNYESWITDTHLFFTRFIDNVFITNGLPKMIFDQTIGVCSDTLFAQEYKNALFNNPSSLVNDFCLMPFSPEYTGEVAPYSDNKLFFFFKHEFIIPVCAEGYPVFNSPTILENITKNRSETELLFVNKPLPNKNLRDMFIVNSPPGISGPVGIICDTNVLSDIKIEKSIVTFHRPGFYDSITKKSNSYSVIKSAAPSAFQHDITDKLTECFHNIILTVFGNGISIANLYFHFRSPTGTLKFLPFSKFCSFYDTAYNSIQLYDHIGQSIKMQPSLLVLPPPQSSKPIFDVINNNKPTVVLKRIDDVISDAPLPEPATVLNIVHDLKEDKVEVVNNVVTSIDKTAPLPSVLHATQSIMTEESLLHDPDYSKQDDPRETLADYDKQLKKIIQERFELITFMQTCPENARFKSFFETYYKNLDLPIYESKSMAKPITQKPILKPEGSGKPMQSSISSSDYDIQSHVNYMSSVPKPVKVKIVTPEKHNVNFSYGDFDIFYKLFLDTREKIDDYRIRFGFTSALTATALPHPPAAPDVSDLLSPNPFQNMKSYLTYIFSLSDDFSDASSRSANMKSFRINFHHTTTHTDHFPRPIKKQALDDYAFELLDYCTARQALYVQYYSLPYIISNRVRRNRTYFQQLFGGEEIEYVEILDSNMKLLREINVQSAICCASLATFRAYIYAMDAQFRRHHCALAVVCFLNHRGLLQYESSRGNIQKYKINYNKMRDSDAYILTLICLYRMGKLEPYDMDFNNQSHENVALYER